MGSDQENSSPSGATPCRQSHDRSRSESNYSGSRNTLQDGGCQNNMKLLNENLCAAPLGLARVWGITHPYGQCRLHDIGLPGGLNYVAPTALDRCGKESLLPPKMAGLSAGYATSPPQQVSHINSFRHRRNPRLCGERVSDNGDHARSCGGVTRPPPARKAGGYCSSLSTYLEGRSFAPIL